MNLKIEETQENIFSPKQQKRLYDSLTPQYQIQEQEFANQNALNNLISIKNEGKSVNKSMSSSSLLKKPEKYVKQKHFHHHASHQHQYNHLSKHQHQYLLGDKHRQYEHQRRNTQFVNLLENEHIQKDSSDEEDQIQFKHFTKLPKLNLVSQFQGYSAASTQPFTTPAKSLIEALQDNIKQNLKTDENESGILTPRSVHDEEVKLGHKDKMKNFFRKEEIHRQLRNFKFENSNKIQHFEQKKSKRNSFLPLRKISILKQQQLQQQQQLQNETNQKNEEKSHKPKFIKLTTMAVKQENEIVTLCKDLLNEASQHVLTNQLTLEYQLQQLEQSSIKLKILKGQRTLKSLLDSICSYSKKIVELFKNLQMSQTDFVCNHQQVLKRIVELGLKHTNLPNGQMETKFVADKFMFEGILDLSQRIEEQLINIGKTDILTKRGELFAYKQQLLEKEKRLRRSLGQNNSQQRVDEITEYYDNKYNINLNVIESNLDDQIKNFEYKLGNLQYVPNLQRGYSQNINNCVGLLKKDEAKLSSVLY